LNVIKRIEQRVVLPDDSETRRSQKTISTTLMFAGGAFTVLNVVTYLTRGMWVAGIIYAVWAFTVLAAALLVLSFPRFWLPILSGVIIGIIPMVLATHVFSGGFQSGLETAVWMLQVPLAAALFLGPRFTIASLFLYVVGISAATYLESFALSVGPHLALSTRMQIAAGNLIMLGVIATAAGLYLLQRVNYFRQRADNLLLNILPAPIALRLKEGSETIADGYREVTVLFADIVGSTSLFANLEPGEAVDWLNEVFTMFDGLVEKYGLEKIRTIGDNYMVASGVPIPRADHAQAMANFALDMVHGVEEISPRYGKRLNFRVGINSGPLVAGVIGRSKFQYDLWGDTVNIASRMESHGEVGKVHITSATYELLKDEFDCISRGLIPIKGKGLMETWFVVERKTRAL
jgi:adenylate cyclase